MEGRRDDVTGGGGSGDESDGSSSGVGLNLRLRTGSNHPPAMAAAAGQQGGAARRSMAIFYDGRVCAVDVTEIQAREIISMANQEILADQRRQQQHREDRHVQDRGSSSSSAAARCGSQVMRPAGSPLSPAAGSPRQGLATMATPVMTDQAGLSMKRSLQRFLQKREARRTAGGRQAQTMRH